MPGDHGVSTDPARAMSAARKSAHPNITNSRLTPTETGRGSGSLSAAKQPVCDQDRSIVRPRRRISNLRHAKAPKAEKDPEIDIGAHSAAAVAAERNIEIVADPRGERDMPAAPELGKRGEP